MSNQRPELPEQIKLSLGADDATSSAAGDVLDNGCQDGADWIPLVSPRLEELRRLKPNWNSYGAQEINPAVIDYVRSFLEEYGRGATHGPQIVPTNRGGIQIEWHRVDGDLDVQFDSPEHGYFFYQDREHGTEIEGELPADLPKLKGILRAMTR